LFLHLPNDGQKYDKILVYDFHLPQNKHLWILGNDRDWETNKVHVIAWVDYTLVSERG